MAKEREQLLLQLPPDVLAMVLKHISMRERVRSCSLVCHAWRAAAAAATTALMTTVAANSSSLSHWLRAHGGNLSHISVDHFGVADQQTPCFPFGQLTQLRTCYLHDCLLQAELAAAATGSSLVSAQSISKHDPSSTSNPLCHLSSLTSLHLSYITFDRVSLRSLSALKSLQDLTLGKRMWIAVEGKRQHQPAEDLCLQQLTQLTCIQLEDPCCFPTAAVAPFSSLQQLQWLQMQHNLAPAKRAARLLAALPASLTHLEFAYAGEQQLQFRDVPAIAGLTALHTLRIRRWDSNADITKAEEAAATGGLDPLLLARMQQLQVLELGWLGRGALPALLQVMPQLSSLRRLDLQCEAVVALPASEAARYSNLLPASKHLSKLVLRGTARMLPDARYGCHLFAGRQLPQLQQLALGWDPEAADDPVEDADDLPPPFLDSEAMQAMAGCCPALHTLLAPGCVTEDAQLAPLLQLTALSALFLAGDEIDDDFAEQQLALLVGLKELRVNLASELTDVGVAHLTALTGLHSLILEDCSISEDMSGILHDEGRLELHYRESTGESVAQQLRPRARRAVLLAALEAEEQAGGMEAPGALQALLGAHCGSCQQLREQLEAAQARADAAEAAAAKTSATLTTVATLLKMVLRQVAAERKAHAQQLPQQPAAAVHVEGQ